MTAGYPVAPARYNQVFEAKFRGGLIGFFAGENQTKSVNRQVELLNAQGLSVAAMVLDRWNFWRRFVAALIFICTLGWVGRVPNVLIVTEPMRLMPSARPTPLSPERPAQLQATDAVIPKAELTVRKARAIPKHPVSARKATPRKTTTKASR
ncbi:MAG: hypothetical protein QOG53_193 [Frankiales bacterium]|jgi:hypothetical protein|nr:hypothetical protein [Frankiales bacterium]